METAQKLQPAPLLLLELSSSERHHRQGDHHTVIEDIRQIVEGEVAIILPQGQFMEREDLGRERRESTRAEQPTTLTKRRPR
jgi:hypothetical protein